jgi:DNA polymerase-3 subunit beta
MEFVIEKGTLVRELQTVTGVVEKRATLPILANLLLEAGREGLQVGASDLEVTVRGTARASVVKEGSVTLPAAKLHEIARSLPEAEVQFKLLDRHQVAISCERTRYRISGQAREDFPKFPDLDVKRGIELPGTALREMIDRVAFAITTEDPRYSLNGALFLLEPGSMTLVATDGHRLAYASRKVDLALPGGEQKLIVPRKALGEVAKLAASVEDGQSILFGRSGNHLWFRVGSHLLTSTVLEGNFPRYENVMPKACEIAITLATSDLADAVRRVSLLASDRFGKAVKFGLAEGKLELSSETEMGEAHETLAVDYSGDDMTIGFNARYLLEFLGAVSSPSVRVELNPVKPGEEADAAKSRPGDKPGQFRPDPSPDLDYRYIVMPMHL